MSAEQMQAVREERAASETYTFVRGEEDGQIVVWCLSHKSKETYTLTKEAGCSCPDHQFRTRKIGGFCKHMEGCLIAHREGRIYS